MSQLKTIDIHTHVNFAAFNEDKLQVIERAREEGVGMINVGTQQSTSHEAVEIAKHYEEGIYAAVGLHPVHTFSAHHDTDELGGLGTPFTSRSEKFDYPWYKKLASEPKVVAIGECGLDYFRVEDESLLTQQKDIFEAQVCLAQELKKPLMLHIRDPKMQAYEDVLAILGNYRGIIGDVHFFAGNSTIAEKFLDLGFYLSFTGVITFTQAYDEIIKQIPLDRLMVETDAPYVAPVPYRGKRNEPVYVLEVAKRLAEIKQLSLEEALAATLSNANKLFGLNLASWAQIW